MAFYQLCLLVPGLTYYSYQLYGMTGVILAYVILLIYIPAYFMITKHYRNSPRASTTGAVSSCCIERNDKK